MYVGIYTHTNYDNIYYYIMYVLSGRDSKREQGIREAFGSRLT